jgi:hypothetical protein
MAADDFPDNSLLQISQTVDGEYPKTKDCRHCDNDQGGDPWQVGV